MHDGRTFFQLPAHFENGIVTFETQRFSPFALVYGDPAVSLAGSGGEEQTPLLGNSTLHGDTAVQTGDKAGMLVYLSRRCAVRSSGSRALVSLEKRQHKRGKPSLGGRSMLRFPFCLPEGQNLGRKRGHDILKKLRYLYFERDRWIEDLGCREHDVDCLRDLGMRLCRHEGCPGRHNAELYPGVFALPLRLC